MSGLLRRLVDGAAGRGHPPVRSASRSAFAGAPPLLSEAQGLDDARAASMPLPLQPPIAFMRAPAAPVRGSEARASGMPEMTLHEASAERRQRRGQAQVAWQASGSADEAVRLLSTPHDVRTMDRLAAPDDGRPRVPDPLLPPIARVAPPVAGALRGVAATPPVTAGMRQPESNEVHVTIGRIEITAVHEAAPPRRAARTGKPLTSLDDYLRQRQGAAE